MDSSEKIKLVQDRCLEVFEDPTMCEGWVKLPCRVLGNVTPFSFLETHAGIEAVLNELGRIEHGIIP
jgi:putative toxin-antitoxin system antitoxin component (TIGR02293 family)